MDLLPTFAKLIGADLPTDRVIDGKDITPLLLAEPGAQSPHEVFYAYYNNELHAVRDRRFKLHLPHKYRTMAGRPGGVGGKQNRYRQATIGLELFDLKNDRSESINVADRRPEVVRRLLTHAEAARAELGDRLTDRRGAGRRPAARVP